MAQILKETLQRLILPFIQIIICRLILEQPTIKNNRRLERSELAFGFANEKSSFYWLKSFYVEMSLLTFKTSIIMNLDLKENLPSSWKVISGFKRDQGMKKNIEAFLGFGFESCV